MCSSGVSSRTDIIFSIHSARRTCHQCYDIAHQQHADDTTLNTGLDLSNGEPPGYLDRWTKAVEFWFPSTCIQLNPTKTEFIPIGTRQQLVKNAPAIIEVADTEVQLSEK